MDLFTSDSHYYHNNILRYCDRPFANLDEMHRAMIVNWNNCVSPLDTVYHLGDFAFGPVSNVKCILEKLNGKTILVRGNHDRSANALKDVGFSAIYNDLTIEQKDGDKTVKVRMQHHPPKPGSYYDVDYILCGHVHQNWHQ